MIIPLCPDCGQPMLLTTPPAPPPPEQAVADPGLRWCCHPGGGCRIPVFVFDPSDPLFTSKWVAKNGKFAPSSVNLPREQP